MTKIGIANLHKRLFKLFKLRCKWLSSIRETQIVMSAENVQSSHLKFGPALSEQFT